MRTVLALALVLVALGGCSSAGTATQGGARTGAPSVALPPAPSPALSSAAPSTASTSDALADATIRKLVGLAREQLATLLGVTAEEVALVSVAPVQWRDASLGCPKPNIDYVPMTTPGFRITLQVGGSTYEYHVDQASHVVRCATGE